jgi:hypothetical protein
MLYVALTHLACRCGLKCGCVYMILACCCYVFAAFGCMRSHIARCNLRVLLPLLLQVHDLVEVAWALAQWETPMPPNWAKVRQRCTEQHHKSLCNLVYAAAAVQAPGSCNCSYQAMSVQAFDFFTCLCVAHPSHPGMHYSALSCQFCYANLRQARACRHTAHLLCILFSHRSLRPP